MRALCCALAVLLLTGFQHNMAVALDLPTSPKKCESGHVLTPHTPPTDFSFATTSWERSFKNAFVYTACVENDEKKRELFVDWHIPQVKGKIPIGDSRTTPRISDNHNTKTVSGCLIYGNNRDVMYADFLGTEGDVKSADKQGDCAELRAQPVNKTGPLHGFPGFEAEGRMIFPTNSADAENTEIRFVYDVGLLEGGENYTMIFNYAAAPVDADNFKGSIKDISIQPSNELLLEPWAKAGLKGALSENRRDYKLFLPTPKRFTLTQQDFIITDQAGNTVGTIPAPFLTEFKE